MQWEQGSNFLREQGQHFDIASLLNCLHQLKTQNSQLEEYVRSLISRRDHLLAVNARLSLPFGTSLSSRAHCDNSVDNLRREGTPHPTESAIDNISDDESPINVVDTPGDSSCRNSPMSTSRSLLQDNGLRYPAYTVPSSLVTQSEVFPASSTSTTVSASKDSVEHEKT